MAWRFEIDGEDVSDVAFQKTATRVLNGIGSGGCRIPSRELADITGFAIGSSRLKVYDDSNVLWHHGIVWHLNDDGDENTCYTTITSVDPMALWPMRPARDADGDFSLPSFITDFGTGPQILQEILTNSVTHEGDLFLDMSGGTVETGGVDVSGLPVDWPMTIADIASLLFDTGMVDVVIDPIEVGSAIGRFNAYNGGYGSDLSGSVVFQYGMGAYNVRRAVRTQAMDQMCNKLWYLLGPKKQTVDGTEMPQRWRGNVTGDHPQLPNPPGGDIDDLDPLGALRANSQADYWVSMDVRVFDTAYDGLSDDPESQDGYEALYLRLWQAEQEARVGPRTLCKITPVRGTEPTFTVGDLIGVQAGSVLRGGFSEVQRVHRVTVNIDDNGVVDLGELLTTSDGESL